MPLLLLISGRLGEPETGFGKLWNWKSRCILALGLFANTGHKQFGFLDSKGGKAVTELSEPFQRLGQLWTPVRDFVAKLEHLDSFSFAGTLRWNL